MTYGFFLKVTLSPDERIQSDDSGDRTVLLPPPIGAVLLRGSPRGTAFSDAPALMFSGAGYPARTDAEAAGRALKDAVQLASLDIGLGIDTGLDVATGGPTQVTIEAAARQGVQLLPDVHGLQVFKETEYPPVSMGLTARGTVLSPLDSFTNSLVIRTHNFKPLDDKRLLACRLYAHSRSESSQRGRLLTLVTVLDLLSETLPRTGLALKIANEALETAKARRREGKAAGVSEAELSQVDALLSALGGLRNQSISASIKRLADAASADVLVYGKSADQIVDEAYKARNELIHGGRTGVDLTSLITPLEQLTVELCSGPPLSVKDVCQLMNRSESTVLRYIRQGDLVAAKHGRKWRIQPKRFKEFLWRKSIQLSPQPRQRSVEPSPQPTALR
jgi:excisionase family DNA binding protein